MATFEPNIDWKTRTSGTLPIGPTQEAMMCPKCGSPYVATFTETEARPRFQESTIRIEDVRLLVDKKGRARGFERSILGAVPGLACIAGDCGWVGDACVG
jgi:hypothetical protein